MQEIQTPVEEMTTHKTRPRERLILLRKLRSVVTRISLILIQWHQIHRPLGGGVYRPEVRGDEPLDSRGDAGEGDPVLEVGLGAFASDGGDDGVLAAQGFCDGFDGEGVVDFDYGDAGGVGGGGGGGGAFQDCDGEVVG